MRPHAAALATVTAALLAVPGVTLLGAAPAFAAAHVICVGNPGGSCDATALTIQDAITAANTNALDDVIRVGAGTYQDGPWVLTGTAHAITLQGIGASTILTLPANPASQQYVFTDHATVQDLTIKLATAMSDNDYGLAMFDQSSADHVTVDGTGTNNADGVELGSSTITASSILLPPAQPSQSRAIFSNGGNTITDSMITGAVGLDLSDPGTFDTLSRLSIRSDYTAVVVDSGTINLDDSVVDLGTSAGAGLAAVNFNNGPAPKTINADHVTVVGGGAGSKGVWAYAAAQGTKTTSIVALTNSIVRGPATSLVTDAGNDGAQGGTSAASISVSYSDWHNQGGTIGPNGAGGVTAGAGNLDVDPAFVNAAGADYHLAAGSPLIDKGNPASGGPTTDRDGNPRVTDGNGDGTAVSDLGAYERPTLVIPDTTPPSTEITSHPGRRITKSKAKFSFTSSEPGSHFLCQLDKGPFLPCTSPAKYKVHKHGKHVFSVYAVDAAGNADTTPATVKFRRVKKRR